MPNWLGSALIAATLATLSVSPKIWLQRHSAQVDGDRLNRDIAHHLTAAGFRVELAPEFSVPAVRAMRRGCRLVARNGDRARELHDIFNLESVGHGPASFGYRHRWGPHPAGVRAVMERFAQNGLARVGMDFARPAVIALSTAGPCTGVQNTVGDLSVHAFLKEAAPENED